MAASSPDARADLKRLFALRDEDLQRHAQASPSSQQFAATEPAGLVALPPTARNGHHAAVPASFAKMDVFRRPDLPQ